MTDEALMAAYVAGSRQAFEVLFARLAPRVHRFFQRSLGTTALADDLLQITFMKIHRARGEYRPELPLKPWLFAIAGRVRLDELRRRYRLPEHADEEQFAKAEAAQALEQSAEAAAESTEIAARVRAAVARLPETQRVVVHLHRFEGMTFSEIAAALGTSESAVKLRAFRAYEQLRKQLVELVADEDPDGRR